MDELILRVREREWSHRTTQQEVFLQSIITVNLLSFLRSKSHLLPLRPHWCDFKGGCGDNVHYYFYPM